MSCMLVGCEEKESNTYTLIDKCLADKEAQKQLYSDTIRDYLSGVADANGVSLLYMGMYPTEYL